MKLNYFAIFIFLLISLVLSFIIYFASFLLIEQKQDFEKLIAYECGFNPYDDARKIFDINFYLIGILFIIFDLEAVFFFPYVVTISSTYLLGYWTIFEFLIELIIGFIYIWLNNALEWN